MEVNKSSYFVMPILGKHYLFYGDSLENCYLYEQNGLTNCVCFVFNRQLSEQKDEEMRKLPGFLDCISKRGSYSYIYLIPDEFVADIELFKAGKYSLMSDTYKQRVLSCNVASTVKDISSTQLYGILYKTRAMRDYWKNILGEDLPSEAECWSIPNLQEEVLM